jgi:1-acyl-sn-glycerol-3-phosphate acyltransferase
MTKSALAPTTTTKQTTPLSRFVPWLKSLIYPIVNYLVLPTYFSEIEIIGRENLPKQGAIIFAPTHRSRWDSMVIPYAVGHYATGRDLHFMVSINEIKSIQGWFIRRLGGFAIDTEKPTLSSIRYTIELLANREMLGIFPEGNLFYDNTIHPLKTGLARIAMQTIAANPDLELYIVPIGSRYIEPIPRFRDRVKISIGQPIDVRKYRELSTKTGTQTISDLLATALGDLTKDL